MFDFNNFDKQVKQKGITKVFLAQQIGKHPVVFHDWAKGKSNPSEADLKIIANCLGCTASYLRGQVLDPKVKMIPVDPKKVKNHEELLEQQREESYEKLVEGIKKLLPNEEQPISEEDMEIARRINSLPPEKRARALDQLDQLEKQDI